MFGDALYFSDNFEKSFDYTSKDDIEQTEHCYMLVCEVALGNIANYPGNWSSNVYRPPEGCHSVRIMTGYGPDFRHNTYYRIPDFSDRLLPYPVIVPIGSFIKYPAPKVQSG